MKKIKTGLENLLKSPPGSLDGKKLGLLCNPASVGPCLTSAAELIARDSRFDLRVLFSPQHGFFSEKQDNMIESDHITDPLTRLKVYSLYGAVRKPEKEMFDDIDVLLIDLLDVGTRVYTFIYTISYCMEAAREHGVEIVILDRPNPVGGTAIEGNILEPEYASFVGRYPIPMRHGMTVGELATLFNEHFNIGCDLSVIPMTGWERDMYYEDTGLVWVLPSPNLPTSRAAMVYPGQVIWEGTNVSEARGTTMPFDMVGAPYIDQDRLLEFMGGREIPGVLLRPVSFEPTSNKWAGNPCRGFQLHVTDRNRYNSYGVSLKLFQGIMKLHRDAFEYKQPPYEYEYEKLPMDLILGSRDIRKRIEAMESIDELEASWKDGLEKFGQVREKFFIY